MSIAIPVEGHPIRELIDMEQLAKLDPRQLPGFVESKSNARNFFEREPAALSIHTIVHRADGAVELVTHHRKGATIRLWKFGYTADFANGI